MWPNDPQFDSDPPPEAIPPERPTFFQRCQDTIRKWLKRFQGVLLFSSGLAIALTVFLVYDTLRAQSYRITSQQVEAEVQRFLSSATPKPPISRLVYNAVLRSVVVIEVKDQKGETTSTGSGVILDTAGNILSCLHVVENSEQIDVIFFDGTRSAARIAAQQPAQDIVLLRVQVVPPNIQPATLASAASLRVGDEAFVLGHPFGVSYSFSSGVISGLERSFQPPGGQRMTGLIQFDAAVNPGNSGGPLINRNGEVVGIVTALLNPMEEKFFVGIGFAVPIEAAAEAGGPPPY